MRRIALFALVLAVAIGCGKKAEPTVPEGPPAFAGDSSEKTLAWLAGERNALDAAGDKEAAEKFKALAETMKGKTLSWRGTLSWTSPDKTYGVTAWTLHTDAPEPKSEEKRERHYAMVCKPFEPGVTLEDNAPFVRKPQLGFPSAAGDWHNEARPGKAVTLTGTVAAVQVHRNSWVTGYGVKDRVVHTEVAVTLHIQGGGLAP